MLSKPLRRVWTTLRDWGLLGDLRSTAVGSFFGALIGAIVGLITAALAEEPPIVKSVFTNVQGYAKPMQVLLDFWDTDKPSIKVAFDPSNLEDIYVCEYSRMVGSTSEEILLQYLDKYSMCLAVTEKNEGEYIVRPNRNSGELTEANGQWFCKCAGPTGG